MGKRWFFMLVLMAFGITNMKAQVTIGDINVEDK